MTFALHPYFLSLSLFSVFLLCIDFYKFCNVDFKYVPSVLLIYSLFTDDVSSSDFIALNDRMIIEQRFRNDQEEAVMFEEATFNTKYF
jgi:hypothetical protein